MGSQSDRVLSCPSAPTVRSGRGQAPHQAAAPPGRMEMEGCAELTVPGTDMGKCVQVTSHVSRTQPGSCPTGHMAPGALTAFSDKRFKPKLRLL